MLQIEVADGKTTPLACKEAEITVQSYYRWRKEYSGLHADQSATAEGVASENAKLKRLEKLKDIASGNF